MSLDEQRIAPRAKIQWPVIVQKSTGVIEGVTLNISSTGVFIGCRRPLRLNEVFDMVITTPEQDIGARAEVVWSNKYGPDDHITPRGMGVRFLDISEEDQRFIAKTVNQYNSGDQKDKNLSLSLDEN
ncbi:MAG: PilZ domain-containing protein [Deltaproteobacteria bacterium]|nr:PilZ domain-containing protein [Deltaproteobacteria bacterium]